jgi:phenylalanyl-tRNA synthetase beta chain
VNGYDRIGSELPVVRQAGGAPGTYVFAHRIRDALARAGLREAWLLSFASQADLDLTGDTDAIRVANPLVADEGFMRARLTPGLLRAVARNQARGVRSVGLFEVGSVFRAGDPVDERPKVAFAMNGAADRSWYADDRAFDVLDAKGALEALLFELGIEGWALGEPLGAPLFHPGRSCMVMIDGERAGVLGEIHPRIAGNLEIAGRVAVVELEGRALQAASGGPPVLRDVPRFPPVRRDLAFVVPEAAPAGAVRDAIIGAGGDLLDSCELFDVFRGGSLPQETKSLAFSLGFRAPDRTLTDGEADERIATVVEAIATGFGGELRTAR